jgi:thiol-disulfide isomerase/thioredoxin
MTAVRILLCAAVLLSCCLIPPASAGDEKPVARPAAAAIELQPGTWKDVTALVAKHKGKIVVVDVWSTSCAPCMQEFPGLVKLQQDHPEQVVCISFNVDYVGIRNKPADFYRPKVEAFLKKQQAQFVNILCTDESDKFFAEQELSSIPAVYVFGADGKLAKRFDESLLQEGREEAFTYAADIAPFVKQQLAGGK